MGQPIGSWVCGGPDGHGLVADPDRSEVVPCCPVCRSPLLETVADPRWGRAYRLPAPPACPSCGIGWSLPNAMLHTHRGCLCARGGHAVYLCQTCRATTEAPRCLGDP